MNLSFLVARVGSIVTRSGAAPCSFLSVIATAKELGMRFRKACSLALTHRFALICSVLLVIAVRNIAQNIGDHRQPNSSAATQSDQMEITIFARFHALDGKEGTVASELRDAVIRVRTGPGGLGIEVYRSVRDPRLFWLHSRWVDEPAFDKHAERPEISSSSATSA